MAKLEHELNPFEMFPDIDVPRGNRSRAMEEVSDFIGEQVLSDVGSARSPVTGKAFKGLSKDYKKRKLKSGPGIANLELTGDMLDHFETRVSGYRVKTGVYGPKSSVDKAKGHNQHPGDEHPFLPVRSFIPNPGGEFRRGIRNGIRKILKRYERDE